MLLVGKAKKRQGFLLIEVINDLALIGLQYCMV